MTRRLRLQGPRLRVRSDRRKSPLQHQPFLFPSRRSPLGGHFPRRSIEPCTRYCLAGLPYGHMLSIFKRDRPCDGVLWGRGGDCSGFPNAMFAFDAAWAIKRSSSPNGLEYIETGGTIELQYPEDQFYSALGYLALGMKSLARECNSRIFAKAGRHQSRTGSPDSLMH